MSNPVMMRAENVCRNFGSKNVLNNISFTASKGEVAGFLGPNGAGKSTLMQIISGTLAASKGTVSLAGFDIQKTPIRARATLGYLPDQPPLYTDCDIDSYLLYCAKIHDVPANCQADVVETVKEQCGLGDKGNSLIQGLSKGYQQRAGLAQAIIHSPEILVLDEPNSGLDPNQMMEMRNLISKLKKDHCVIFSTHILSEAYLLCDHIIIIFNGEIALNQPIKYFKNEKELEQAYVAQTGIIAEFHDS